MAIQTKITLRFDGAKVDAFGPRFRVEETMPGDVAMGSEGPIAQHTGTGVRCSISGLTFRIRPTGLTFDPRERMRSGQEFELSWDEGDPAFGGKTYTMQECLCRGKVTDVNNENGDIQITVPQVVGTRIV